jgi:uncharacterized membrane protein
MTQSMTILVIGACLAVLAVLLVGLGSFAKGGENASRFGNKIMQLRVALQAVAVVVIVTLAWIAGGR